MTTSESENLKINRVLQARARALARVPHSVDESERLDVVVFRLAHEHYAVETRYLREVAVLEQITPVPCTPAFVLGIMNLRGKIVSVLDLKTFFDLPVRGLTDLDKVMVLEDGDMGFAVLADAIDGVRRVPLAELQKNLITVAGTRAEYLRGIVPGPLMILDAARLLNDSRIVVREESRA